MKCNYCNDDAEQNTLCCKQHKNKMKNNIKYICIALLFYVIFLILNLHIKTNTHIGSENTGTAIYIKNIIPSTYSMVCLSPDQGLPVDCHIEDNDKAALGWLFIK